MSTLYTFRYNMIPYRTESVHFFVPMNSAMLRVHVRTSLESRSQLEFFRDFPALAFLRLAFGDLGFWR